MKKMKKNNKLIVKVCENSENSVENTMDNRLVFDDIVLMCAKHTLWRLGEGPEDYKFDFDKHNFRHENFTNMDLCAAKLSNCEVKDCRFEEASMVFFEADNVRFVGCDFERVYIEISKFTNCEFIDCYMDKDFLNAREITNTTFTNCQFDNWTLSSFFKKGLHIDDIDNEGNVTFIFENFKGPEYDNWN